MSHSADPDHFFQTDASNAARNRRAAKASNKNGDPIVLQSKILSITADPFSPSHVYVAESAGCVRRIGIADKDAKQVFRGPQAPVTSVAIGGHNGDTVFAGCWDKDIWSWNRTSGELKTRYKGHSDFVKAVLCVRLSGKDCLVSGGADGKIMVWDVSTGERLHTLRDKTDSMRSVQRLVIDPIASTPDEAVVFSASSDPHIRRWRISLTAACQSTSEASKSETIGDAIHAHETSVYDLFFDADDEDGDLWTASADGAAKCLSRARSWETEEAIQHGDYVRAVVVNPDWIITAGRSEDINVWNRVSGKIYHTFEGHYEEVSGMVLLRASKQLVSAGIDGTVRTWPVGRAELDAHIEALKKRPDCSSVAEPPAPVLTADEEAELAELMEESD